ncbi:putative MFS family arabinose efflux permease [Salana multivorans]|uniref:Putative MFS family arabinose efflux permease n=1 Tax=Salana multivorans TaxID=120377 RepID=A0A3N2D2H4_9MICO|nr:MFS transporter [Salana multivorans]ROR93975.1 putative MFS family arabinose efflux permease [Salana multivorans]
MPVTDPFGSPEPAGSPATLDRSRVDALRRRTIVLLSVAQVFSGLAAGSVVSIGSLLAVEITGNDAFAGSVTTAATLGAAFSALWLARLALARGRRASLSSGLLLASVGAVAFVLASVWQSFPLLLAGGALMGVGSAVNLQARFAATDLSTPGSRARDLSLVVWMSTVGAVTGPNLVGLGGPLGRLTGLPELGAAFLFSLAGMLAAMLVLWIGLRPDPLAVAREGEHGHSVVTGVRTRVPITEALATLARFPRAVGALLGILVAHAVMVAVMSMTPVHMAGHGASISLVGLTVSLHIAGMYALSPVMGWLSDRIGAPVVLVLGLLTQVAAVAVAGTSGASAGATTIGLVLLGVGWSAATVAGSSSIAGAVPGDGRVAIQGLSDSLMSFAGAGGGALAGVALARIGYDGLNLAAGVLAAAGAVAAFLVQRRAATRDAPVV